MKMPKVSRVNGLSERRREHSAIRQQAAPEMVRSSVPPTTSLEFQGSRTDDVASADICQVAVDLLVTHYRLSNQMEQLLRLSLTGKSNKEIAAQMGINPRTLSTYWARIYEKTRTRDSHEFWAFLFRHGVTAGRNCVP